MKLWKWQEHGLATIDEVELNPAKPTLIICGGGFNVDCPAAVLGNETEPVNRFFDFAVKHIKSDRDQLRIEICCPIEDKLRLSYFIMRKLLGLVSAFPGDRAYPESLSAGFSDSVELIEVTYTGVNEVFHNLLRSYESIEYVSVDAKCFFARVFAPLVRRCFPHDIDGLCQRLSLVTLFGISYGSSFLIEVENVFAAFLAELGCDQATQHRIMESITSVAVSNMSNVRAATGPRFRTVYIEGTTDRLAEWLNPHKIPVADESEWSILRLTAHRLLVLAPVTISASAWVEVIPEFDYNRLSAEQMGHYLPFYAMRCVPETLLPGLLETVLQSATRRQFSDSVDLEDLVGAALGGSVKLAGSVNCSIKPLN